MCFEVGVSFFPFLLQHLINPKQTHSHFFHFQLFSCLIDARAERSRAHIINRDLKSAKKKERKGLWCAFVDFHTS